MEKGNRIFEALCAGQLKSIVFSSHTKHVMGKLLYPDRTLIFHEHHAYGKINLALIYYYP